MDIRFIGSMGGGICRWQGWTLRSMEAQGHRNGLLCGGIGGGLLLDKMLSIKLVLCSV